MLYGLLIILVCQLIGEIIVQSFGILVPGPVLGMLILFVGLLIKKGVPAIIETASQPILKYIGLIYVPPGVGMIVYLNLIVEEWLIVLVAGVGTTMLTLLCCGLMFQLLGSGDKQE